MMAELGGLWRGLMLLRHPELIRDLAERRHRLLLVAELRAQFPAAKVGSDVRLLGFDVRRIHLGERANVCDGTILSLGDEANGPGEISIGANTWVGQNNNFRAGGGAIRVGRDCLISQYCSLVASNHSIARALPIREQVPRSERRDVILGDDVWLGAGAAVMPGVRIGHGAVIGANGVVTSDVPDFEIWGGVPARKLGERT